MPELYRKRLIPNECIHLKDDEIVYSDENYLITRWRTLKPKAEFSHGISLYCIENGWKISKFFDSGNKLTYIYCDIIDTEYDKKTDTYVFTDLLADVIIENNSLVRVVDIDELADACEDEIIRGDQLCTALRRLDGLLKVIYSGKFRQYIDKLDEFC
jgi:predicted RNA-binding protein associated with RNAse of E/G family